MSHKQDIEELLSFVIPANNEADSLPLLCEEIRAAMKEFEGPYEIVIVDDGSTDGTTEWLKQQEQEHDDLNVLFLPERGGQSGAMAKGIEHSRGQIIVTLDADLQNDPADSLRLVKGLDECDLVCGVRAKRKDIWAKRVGSKIANKFRRWILHDRFRDVGCTLKAWRRPVAERIPKFDGFHRFIPILAEAEGFKVTEQPVSHRHREHGDTHYGQLSRACKGLKDLVRVARLIRKRAPRPPLQKTDPEPDSDSDQART